jgi:hypothetical protein
MIWRWNRTMLNLCGIVVAILKMATGRNFSMLGINSGHHYLPTYQILMISDNVEFLPPIFYAENTAFWKWQLSTLMYEISTFPYVYCLLSIVTMQAKYKKKLNHKTRLWNVKNFLTVFWPPYPWYIEPPTHGILTPLSMVFLPPPPCLSLD